MSLKLAVRMRLLTDTVEAFVEARERLVCGEVGEVGEVGAGASSFALCSGDSGCGNGTGVGTLVLDEAMAGNGRSD